MKNRIRYSKTAARLALAVGVLCAALAVSSSHFWFSPASRAATRDEQTERTFAALLAKARASGLVRVIVGLRLETQPEGALPSARVVGQQRATIAQAQDALLNRLYGYDAASVKRMTTIPFFVVEVDAIGLQALRADEEVLTIEEDVPVPPTLAQSTVLIGAPAVWSSGYTGAGQYIAVLDTGFDLNHSMLAGKTPPGAQACYSTTSAAYGTTSVCPGGVSATTADGSAGLVPANTGGYNHGTHVAGIALGKNGSLAGVAKDAKLIAIQVFSRLNNPSKCYPNSTCLVSYPSDQVLALERVANLHTGNSFTIAAVNMSLGGGKFTAYCDAANNENIALTTKIKHLRSYGIPTVVSSGNGDQYGVGFPNALSSPACISAAISVGSSTDFGVETVSNFSNSANFLNLLAPGQTINSSLPFESYGNLNGTSMAAPHVAGAWAVLKSKVPNASVDDVLNVLTATGKPITDPKNNITKPRIRLDAASNALCPYANYALAPANKAAGFCATGGNQQVTVTTPASCLWTAVSNASWITITAGASGGGNGAVKYAVQPCGNFKVRTGTMTIAGQTFTVKQDCRCFPVPDPSYPPAN